MAKSITDKTVVLFAYNAVPTATNAITTSNVPFVKPNLKSQTYKDVGTGKLGNQKTYIDPYQTDTSFDLEVILRGNDKTGVDPTIKPKISQLLKASGLVEAVGADNVTYTPNHDYVEPSTCLVYQDDAKRQITGAMCEMKISGTVGEAAKATFTVQGFTSPAPTTETNPTVTLDDNSLMIVSYITAVTLDGQPLNIKSFELALNNEIKLDYATALSEFVRKDFAPKLKLTGVKIKGDETAWADLTSDELREINIVLGSGVGKTLTITASQAKTSDMEENDDDGTVGFARTFDLQGDSNGLNQFEIKWS
ncbi:MAG: hypothetical protein IE890_10835 [Arcobacter sp.]|nr:hypothetical protein [Arcobacter sp.]